MKKYMAIAAVIAFSVYGFGCDKKKATMDESQELLSMEQMSTTTAATTMPADAPKAQVDVKVTNVEPTAAALPLPPSGNYKPTGQDIQTALKNAGFYTGTIDGKIGPMTKEAIEDFQKANGLEADGKVGPKTWQALSKHLTAAVADAATQAVAAVANAVPPIDTGR